MEYKCSSAAQAQALFDRFNKSGGDLFLTSPPPDDLAEPWGLMDSYTVVYVAPRTNAEGCDVFVLIRGVRYQCEFDMSLQKITLIRDAAFEPGGLDLFDDQGRMWTVAPTRHPEQWRDWLREKKKGPGYRAPAISAENERYREHAKAWAGVTFRIKWHRIVNIIWHTCHEQGPS